MSIYQYRGKRAMHAHARALNNTTRCAQCGARIRPADAVDGLCVDCAIPHLPPLTIPDIDIDITRWTCAKMERE